MTKTASSQLTVVVCFILGFIKVNESQYRQCGITPHFLEIRKYFPKYGEVRGAITIDDDGILTALTKN